MGSPSLPLSSSVSLPLFLPLPLRPSFPPSFISLFSLYPFIHPVPPSIVVGSISLFWNIHKLLPVPELPPKTYTLPKTVASPWHCRCMGENPKTKEFGPRQLACLLLQTADLNSCVKVMMARSRDDAVCNLFPAASRNISMLPATKNLLEASKLFVWASRGWL